MADEEIILLLKALHAKLDILMTARSTPKEVLLAEKLHTPGNTLTVGDTIRLCVCSRQGALNLMRSLADKEPDKYKFRVGDKETKRASILIRRSLQAKQIDFASICRGQTKVSVNQLAKEHGLEFEEVREQATIFCQSLEKKNRVLSDDKGNAWIIKA
jgi:hypothetical protein